ncbi:MAG TPA: heme-binding protein [Rubrivivax sp.]|nr:heme-binding protein [Rubrivivax sp.]
MRFDLPTPTTLALALLLGAPLPGALAQPAGAAFDMRFMTPETALKAAQATLASCRAQGFQVAVAVVDRSGQTQVLLRDRFAGPHTVEMATAKAWTAASFRRNTAELAAETQAGKPMSGIRDLPRVIAAGGGVPIDEGGTLWGAIGVSGGPGGDADESCARAGIKAVADELSF